jgi:hypothetical protein
MAIFSVARVADQGRCARLSVVAGAVKRQDETRASCDVYVVAAPSHIAAALVRPRGRRRPGSQPVAMPRSLSSVRASRSRRASLEAMALRVIGRCGPVGFRSGSAAGWCAGWGDRRRQAMTVSVSVSRPSATTCRRVRCVDFRRHSAGAGRAAHLGRRLLRSGFRARHPARGGLTGHHSAAVPAAVGQRTDRTADGPGPVRPSVPRRRRCAAICAGTPAPIVREPPDRTTGTCEAQHRRHRVPQRRPRRPTAGVVLPVPAAPGSWPSTGR